jgi:hypothetical protein
MAWISSMTNGLADPGGTEHRGFAALRQWRQEVDDLDAGRKDLHRAALRRKRRRVMDRAARHVGGECLAFIANSAGQVDQPAEHGVADRHLERPAGRMGDHAATQPRGRLRGNGANRRLVPTPQ